AIALGMDLMKLPNRPKQLPLLQAAAAIGQNELMDNYRVHFKRYGLNCAQVLLTWDDFGSRQRYLNAKNTLLALLKLDCVPVVNENDTISTDEIKFGDNDRLSALVAKLVEAELLVILSDVDGLLDRNNQVIPVVDEINAEIKSFVRPTKNRTCVGGMTTKLEAAKIAIDSGIPCVIANGSREHLGRVIFSAVVSPEKAGTLFVSKKSLSAKAHWIAFATLTKGKIIVDHGARQALLNSKSLLSVGVLAVEGNFESGDIVGISDSQAIEFARGRSALSSKELEKVKGRRSEKEVIHRDNIVITL
ncbi:MAG: glutamate 5-kinase, partial [Candidatus Omnitrophota bacterium]|nr:glutamate 5-kinase [Candidatus Omnitrophota bacterium]